MDLCWQSIVSAFFFNGSLWACRHDHRIRQYVSQTRAASLRRGREHFGVIKRVLVGDTVTLTGTTSQGYSFSCGHVWMWELNCEEGWAPKNWCFWTVVLEKSLRVPWTARRSNQSILKEISLGVVWKEWCWNWNSSTLDTSCEELTHWKRL